MSDQAREITLRLTIDEAHALLMAPDIAAFPQNNALGDEGHELLAIARQKLMDVLREHDLDLGE